MLDLTGVPLPVLPVTGLTKVQDLDRHDGPLIAHMRHGRGDHYVYYWCDCTTDASRWMLLRVSETDVLRLIDQVVPLDRVIPTGCLDEFVYFIDSGANGRQLQVVLVRTENVPGKYRPAKGVYLDVPEEIALESFAILVEKSPGIKGIFTLPKAFSYAYAVLYSLFILRPARYEKIPWKDGFGGMRFYDWLLNRIPGEDRPIVDAFQYASPGFIKFSLDREVAELVIRALLQLERNETEIDQWYRMLYGYIKEHRLNKLYESQEGVEAWSRHDGYLASATRDLLAAAKIKDNDALLNAATPFEAAKVALSFVRRLRELKKFERDGVARFPRPRQATDLI